MNHETTNQTTEEKKIKKKKKTTGKRIVIMIFGVIILAIIISALSIKNRLNQLAAEKDAGPNSTTVTLGSVSNSIESSGNLEAAEENYITIAEGITADEILVESGDYVKKGDTLANLNVTSIASVLITVQERLDEVDDELDAYGLSDYEEEVLENEQAELESLEEELIVLHDTPKLLATSDGIINEIYLSTEDTETEATAGNAMASISQHTVSVSMSTLSETEPASEESSTEAPSSEETTETPNTEEPASEQATEEVPDKEEPSTEETPDKEEPSTEEQDDDKKTPDEESSTEEENKDDKSSPQVYTGSTGGGSSQTSTASTSINITNAFSIIPQNQVKVSVNVDELDILDVAEGQNATITLDAFEGEFEGTISKVSNLASSSSSSAKYTVEILIPMDEKMRIGMSVSVSIIIEEAENVLTIPMTALQQKGKDTFVYTSKADDGTLSGEVIVETGLSDGSTVEIKSGLSEGDTVYYYKSDDTTNTTGFGNFPWGNEQMPDGMSFPGGNGEKPTGGMPEGKGSGSDRRNQSNMPSKQ